MRFSAIFTLGLAGAALATPLVERASSPADIIAEISSKTDALDSAIKGYSGGDPSKVESASADLVSTITKGTETIKGGDEISTSDALGLPGPVQDLTKKVEQAVDDIIAKKDQFVKAGAGGKVKESLNQQKSAADGLADAITSKVPEALKDIAKNLSAGISKAIQKGIDEYKDVSDSAPSSSAAPTETASATDSASATETGSSSATGSASATSSGPVIPTSSSGASSSAVPSGSSTPTGSGSASATSPPLATGAANKATIGYSLGAVAMAAIAVAV
ncbi:hydrophobic surface binding protein A-domain-containing protein [Aspergillus pseudonomiae]|uniref:Cell wall mannoprotein 1 n=1 Tax=Aspergillus pseudonomiae TaxID=1506151 RepID=A0A5N6HZB1_9EURO|nr:hydrophobic surface binding protein A-domain-containing protein [Aspergillus pseudonomiae]KAB8259726.1 hydrophobic surface binding protein A-domain-containing protein [Aspergillus pseudonomiae]KAE8406542.1 hydrophobic surface binding protein A-domain-containing protein [Aspergillus pseudonomiae]